MCRLSKMKYSHYKFICFPLLFLIGGSCIYVNGKDANPVISNCTIANANNVGIFVDDYARVSCDYNVH